MADVRAEVLTEDGDQLILAIGPLAEVAETVGDEVESLVESASAPARFMLVVENA